MNLRYLSGRELGTNLRHVSLWLGIMAAALLPLAGCNQTVVLSSSNTAGAVGSSSGSGLAASSGSASSATSGSSSGSSGTSSGSTTNTSSGTSSSGSTTGAPPKFVDGGYVICTVSSDAGPVSWLCAPGTYFCVPPGNTGACAQCRSDADCLDQTLPTYDALRPRCDLDSGIPGYQGFCEQCLDSADCVDAPAGAICDLNPIYPLDGIGPPASSLEPPIETLGFETCQKLQVDCRVDGGPDCAALGELCDPATGVCGVRTRTCATDADCVGVTSPVQSRTDIGAMLLPFCLNGACMACDGGVCPIGFCQSDADCGNPSHSPAGPTCDSISGECRCTAGTQCSGPFPACTNLDSGELDDAGQPLGVCGCSSDADCGDGGLACLPGTYQGASSPGYCGLPCTSPDFTSCAAFMQGDVCDPLSGLCSACSSDLQCAQDPNAGGPRCTALESGTKGPCGCLSDSDCSGGWSCDAPAPIAPGQYFSLGACTPAMSRCTPASCGGYFCNWKDGGCVNDVDVGTAPSCLNDYDCGAGAFCVSGRCQECRTNADCRVLGKAGREAVSATSCCVAGSAECPNNSACTETCTADADCVGNPNGTGCISAFNTTQCGCKSDADCAGVANAPHCDLQSPDAQGTCECGTTADCPAGQTCQVVFESHGQCTSACSADSDCASGFFCHPSGTCLPRCDPGHACHAPDPVCDVANFVGSNGQPDAGSVWCYPCLTGDDCGGGLACEVALYPPACGTCYGGLGDCGSGDCLSILDGRCHPTCETGPCPAGQVCDKLDLLHILPNLCYGCVTAADCPNGEGCDHLTHECGTCEGPTAAGAPSDCPPDAVCSNYWAGQSGACLQNCDRVPCPADRPLCRVLPSLTPDHAYCFGCLSDSDCADAGPGAWCDTSVDLTFTCRPPP